MSLAGLNGTNRLRTCETAFSERSIFDELVENHRATLHARCSWILGWSHDADNELQETLLRAWRAASALTRSRAIRLARTAVAHGQD